MKLSNTNKETGVGLIEVMVTVLILSTSLLSLAALQNRSLQFNHEAYLRSQANILAYDMIERIRARPDPVNPNTLSAYTMALGSTPTSTTPATIDLREWATNVAAALPDGKGAVTCTAATALCSVTLQWVEGDIADAGEDGGGTTTSFTYQTRL